MQQHIGLTADDAGRRTGRIQQDGIERFAVPPGRQVAGVGRARIPLSTPTPRRSVSLDALGGGADRCPAPAGAARVALQQMRRLAAGRGAGIQHARSGRGRQRSATCCAEPSWTEASPSAKPARADTAHAARRAQRVGQALIGWKRSRPPAVREVVVARCLSGFTRSHNGAACALASKIAGAVAPFQLDLVRSQAGQCSGGIDRGKPSRVARRNSALTMPGLMRAAEHAGGFDRRRQRGVRGQAQGVELGETRPAAGTQLAVASRQAVAAATAARPRRSARAAATRRNRSLRAMRGRAGRTAAAAPWPVRLSASGRDGSPHPAPWRRHARGHAGRGIHSRQRWPVRLPGLSGHDPTRSRRAFR